MNFFRIIDKKISRDKYRLIIKKKENCHLGQKKLLFAEIEFLTWVSYYINLNDSLILYIGTAPGHHINILKKLFPNNYFILYDPLKTEVHEDNYTKVITGYFNYNTIKDVLQYQKQINKQYLVYISDIRTRETHEDEISIWNDMILQQNWGILLNADYISLKFRLPWFSDSNRNLFNNNILQNEDIIKNLNILYKKKIDDIIIINNNNNNNNNKIQFLSGKIFTQIYPYKRSTETRLFTRKFNGKYKMKNYNCIAYEERLMNFNLNLKDKNYKFKKSDEMSKIFLGYDKSYDCVCEYFILYYYLKFYKKDLNNYHNKIIDLIYFITFEESKKLINKFNFYCILYIYIDFLNRCQKDIKENDKLQIILSQLKIYDELLLNYEKDINKQYKICILNNTLTEKQKNHMINQIIKHKVYYKYNYKVYRLINFIDNKFIVNINDIKYINNHLYNNKFIIS
jgi:hypothetical protein